MRHKGGAQMKKFIIPIFCTLIAIPIGCGKKDQNSANENQQNSARIVFSVGSVSIESAAGKEAAKPEMLLSNGITVVTGEKSQCNILIGESSYVSIKENSILLIESLLKKTGGIEDNSVDLKVGRLVVNPKKLLKDESFRVKTQTAVAAVRGTKFVVDSSAGSDVKISVVEGKVEMKPRVAV
ncbi:MAG: FecR family protein [Spirochaetota bacterium]